MDNNTTHKTQVTFSPEFIKKFIQFSANFIGSNYVDAIKIMIQNYFQTKEKMEAQEIYNDECFNGFDKIAGMDDFSYDEYLYFLCHYPILIQFWILHCKLINVINSLKEEQNNRRKDIFNVILHSINIESLLYKLWNKIITISFDNVKDREFLIKDINYWKYSYESCSSGALYKLEMIYIFLESAINLLSSINKNFYHNMNSILNTYICDSFINVDKFSEEAKDRFEQERNKIIKKDIILGNLEKQHGGNKKRSITENQYILKKKEQYEFAFKLYKKLKFIIRQLENERICKNKVIYNIGNLPLEADELSEYKVLVNEIFKCPSPNTSNKCQYCKKNICTAPKYKKPEWKVLDYLSENYNHFSIHLYIHPDNIHTDDENENITNENIIKFIKTHSEKELALFYVRNGLMPYEIDYKDTDLEKNFKQNVDKSMLNSFSEIKDFEYKEETNIHILNELYFNLREYSIKEDKCYKEKILQLLKKF